MRGFFNTRFFCPKERVTYFFMNYSELFFSEARSIVSENFHKKLIIIENVDRGEMIG